MRELPFVKIEDASGKFSSPNISLSVPMTKMRDSTSFALMVLISFTRLLYPFDVTITVGDSPQLAAGSFNPFLKFT